MAGVVPVTAVSPGPGRRRPEQPPQARPRLPRPRPHPTHRLGAYVICAVYVNSRTITTSRPAGRGGSGPPSRTSPGAVPLQCPGHMFAYQGRGIGAPGLESADDGGRRRGIAERHGEIAEPAFVTDAPDRAALGLREPRGFVPVEEPDEVGRVQAVARREIGLRADLRELVPGA